MTTVPIFTEAELREALEKEIVSWGLQKELLQAAPIFAKVAVSAMSLIATRAYNKAVEDANKIAQSARRGEIDTDIRSIAAGIRALKRSDEP